MRSVLRVHRLGFVFAALISAMTVLTVQSSPAAAAQTVAVNIVVIEGSRTGNTVDAQVKTLKLEEKLAGFGFTSAKVVDALSKDIELESSVSLEILSKSGKGSTLKVKVLEADPKTQMIRLHVAVPELDFSTETKHKKGATLLVALPGGKTKRLFLVITPKL